MILRELLGEEIATAASRPRNDAFLFFFDPQVSQTRSQDHCASKG